MHSHLAFWARGAALVVLYNMAAGHADAAQFRFVITGTVATVDDVGNLYGGAISVGMPFSGSITYDTTMVDIDPTSEIGRYDEDPVGSLMGLTMSVGGFDITTNPVVSDGTIVVRSDTDLFITRINELDSTGPPIDGLEFLLHSSVNDAAITADTIPFDFDLTAFDTTTLSFVTQSGTDFAFVFGDIETLIHNPEPGTAVLLGLGLVAIGLKRRRPTR